MLVRFHVALQACLVLLLAISLSGSARADSWGARTDIGAAALDRQTGKVLWEAWQPDQIPAELSKADKAAVESLLPGAKRSSEAVDTLFPAAVAKDRVVDWVYEVESSFVLAHGKPDAIGAVIARFCSGGNARWRYQLFKDTLYCLRDTHVAAFSTTIKEEPKDKKWEPSWKLDLRTELPAQERALAEVLPMDLHVNAQGVWVVLGSHILQLTPEGRKLAQLKLKHHSMTWFDHHMGTPLTFGKHLVYYRSTNEVIALDWQKKREVWRLETTLSPTISRVVEIEDNLVLVRIGSDVPRTLQEVLARDGDSAKKHSHSTRERIAAARLLHSYGDGYLRKQLGEYREELRNKKDDAEVKQAVAVLDELLTTWPRKRDHQRLLNSCVTALLHEDKPEPGPVFASPASQRLLTWSLLRDLLASWRENHLFLDNEVVTKLVTHCRHILVSGPKAERPCAAHVLLSRHVGWFRLTDSERKALFLSRDASIWQETAESLVMNGWRDELVQWASERAAADQPDILLILSRHQVKAWSQAERQLWLACAHNHPGSVAYLLKALEIEGDIPIAFREPIRAYLEKEIAKPTVKDVDSEGASFVFAALEVLDRWKKSEDTALLRKYLKHPYDRIREHVIVMLEKRGVQQRSSIER